MKKLIAGAVAGAALLASTLPAFANGAPKNGAETCKAQTEIPFAECMKAPAHLCWDEPWVSIWGGHGQCVKFFMSTFYK
jgi:hypothetical protein